MNNLLLTILLLGVFIFHSAAANAQSSRLYFASYLGLNTSNNHEFSEIRSSQSGDIERSNGYSFAGSLGLRLTHQWRVEAELGYHKTDMDSVTFSKGGTFDLGGELNTYLLMLNGYYDIDFEWQKLNPFITAGIGLVWHDGEIEDVSGLAVNATDEDFGFAWQLGGGLKYRVNEDLAFTGSYRYIGTTNAEIDTYDIEYHSHELRLGIEYDIPVNPN